MTGMPLTSIGTTGEASPGTRRRVTASGDIIKLVGFDEKLDTDYDTDSGSISQSDLEDSAMASTMESAEMAMLQDELTPEEVQADIEYYEQQYGMTSEQFLRGLETGVTLDLPHAIGWRLLLEYCGR